MPLPVQLALAVFSGVLLFTAYTGFGQLYLMWVAFLPVLLALRGGGELRAFLLGWVCGAVGQIGGHSWLVQTFTEFGGVSGPVAWLGLGLFAAAQGLAFGLALLCVRRAELRLGLAPVWGLSVAMPAFEHVFPVLFPYSLAYSQYRFLAITQIVELGGLLALTILLMGVNGAAYELLVARIERRRAGRARVAIPAVAFLLCLGYGLLRIPAVDADLEEARELKVALIQTNVGAGAKWMLRERSVDDHLALSARALRRAPDIDLVVWPETVYYHALERDMSHVPKLLERPLGVPLVFGVATAVREGSREQRRITRSHNSLVLAAADGRVLGIYDKVELVPFGEMTPFEGVLNALGVPRVAPNLYDVGESLAHLRMEDGTALLPLICYEDIKPSLVRRLWRSDGPADVLVNVTNDSWYGDSHEPLTHLAMASLRSVETRRALVRATNTGISALVDPVGRIFARTDAWSRDTLVGAVPLVEDERSTPYMTVGDFLGWLALACVVFILIGRAPRTRGRSTGAPDRV
jgi:apolipoprotein N-acyltransferase